MENLFFNTDYLSFQQTLLKLMLMLAISGFIIYLLFFIFSKLLYRKSKFRREAILRLIFLWSLFVFFILFNIYIFFFFNKLGIVNMNFTKAIFYLGILSQIIIYVTVIISFFVKRHFLQKVINNNSLN